MSRESQNHQKQNVKIRFRFHCCLLVRSGKRVTSIDEHEINDYQFEQFASATETREKRDAETTTANILDSIKTGIENTFSEQNIKDAVGKLNEIGEKAKNLGGKVISNFQNAFATDDAAKVPTPAS